MTKFEDRLFQELMTEHGHREIATVNDSWQNFRVQTIAQMSRPV